MALFDLLGRRWALRVLWELRTDPVGFRALRGRCDGMSSSVLHVRLRELVEAELVETDESGLYRLTRLGITLLDELQPLSRWAEHWGRGIYKSPLSGWDAPPPPPKRTRR
jgi:DNA-binding HxlR family transcriptional regulator